jgi:CheY-like chemotaxis protein
MPGEDGYSFIRKLRALSREEGGRTPALALTAYARPEDRTRALVEGFQNRAAKPIEPQELLIVIANVAGRYS